MNTRRLMTAMLMALGISGMLTFWLSTKLNKTRTVQAAATHRYAAAEQNLEPGAVLQASDLKMVDWPSQQPLEGASEKADDLVGRTVLYPVTAGEPIVARQISLPGAGVGLSARIPSGMRAISLRSDEIVGVAGFLLPGTHVDVLMTYRAPSASESVSTTVLQDAQVLTAGQKTQADPDGRASTASVVTLLVKPEDAEKLTLASAQGSIHFVLRNGADHQQVAPHPEDMANLAGLPATHDTPRPVQIVKLEQRPMALEKPYVVQTVSGDKSSADSFR